MAAGMTPPSTICSGRERSRKSTGSKIVPLPEGRPPTLADAAGGPVIVLRPVTRRTGCDSRSSTSHPSRRARRPPRRCATRSTSRAWPTSSAITATGSPSTTAARCSPVPSPEALIGPIAAATERIRVGSGGVMLPHYSPFKVAETFSLLAGLFPGRHRPRDRTCRGHRPDDDLRAAARPPPGGARRLPCSSSPSCSAISRGSLPPDHPFARLAATLPGRPETPAVWLLGSSLQSAIWAAELGLPYAFADFINSGGAEAARLYRERFAEHEHAERRPRVAVAVWAIAPRTSGPRGGSRRAGA